MPQQPRPDPARAARARQVAMRLADSLTDAGIEPAACRLTWPRFLQVESLVAGMLPPASLARPADVATLTIGQASEPTAERTPTP